jgi:hypothetical protein
MKILKHSSYDEVAVYFFYDKKRKKKLKEAIRLANDGRFTAIFDTLNDKLIVLCMVDMKIYDAYNDCDSIPVDPDNIKRDCAIAEFLGARWDLNEYAEKIADHMEKE